MDETVCETGTLIMKDARAARRPLVRAYCRLLLWFLGRAAAAGSVVDPDVKAETSRFPEGFSFALLVHPFGPCMALRSQGGRLVVDKKRARTLTRRQEASRTPGVSSQAPGSGQELVIKIKSLEAAWRLFTFRESTCGSQARDRMAADGNIAATCGVVRILDRMEIYLLPAFLARRAVKRYRRPPKFWPRRLAVYGRTLLGL